jgi:hypothetical protein
MRSQLVTKVVGSFVMGALATYVVVAFLSGGSSFSARASIANAAPPTPRPSAAARGAAPSEELDEMRQNFVALGRALLSHAAREAPPSVAPAPEDPEQLARAALDQRLASAPASPREASRLQAELREILDSIMLEGTAATPVCGSNMCRIDIADADDAHAQRATNGLLERLPKAFASATVLSKGAGERAVYVAKDSATLVLR